MPPRPDLGPRPKLGYTQSPIARAAELRLSTEQVKALAARPNAGAYVIGNEMVLAKAGEPANPLFSMAEVAAFGSPFVNVFLGTLDGAGRFGIGIDPARAEELKGRTDLLVTDLRSIAIRGLVAQDHLPPIAEAKALLHWHLRHQFCANCGAPTNISQCGWRRDCPRCQAQHFPRTDPVVIMLVSDSDRLLLGRRPPWPPGRYSCRALNVSPCLGSPVSKPFLNHRTRCSPLPWVKDSGTTYPCACF